jgi:hypothetical protein
MRGRGNGDGTEYGRLNRSISHNQEVLMSHRVNERMYYLSAEHYNVMVEINIRMGGNRRLLSIKDWQYGPQPKFNYCNGLLFRGLPNLTVEARFPSLHEKLFRAEWAMKSDDSAVATGKSSP